MENILNVKTGTFYCFIKKYWLVLNLKVATCLKKVGMGQQKAGKASGLKRNTSRSLHPVRFTGNRSVT